MYGSYDLGLGVVGFCGISVFRSLLQALHILLNDFQPISKEHPCLL